MSSLTLSGVVLSLRITLALRVTVATLPIGSSGASVAGVVASEFGAAGAGACVGAVCACASYVGSEGPAKTSVAPIIVPLASSASAKDNWRNIRGISVHGRDEAGSMISARAG